MYRSANVARERGYCDLDELVDYREYEGLWSLRFEEEWLKPKVLAMGFVHVRFFGGSICESDGSFRERICELKRQGRPGSVQNFV